MRKTFIATLVLAFSCCAFAQFGSVIDRVKKANEANISFLLYSSRIPQNAGKTRWPIAKTIVPMNPTVSEWREAPQMPP